MDNSCCSKGEATVTKKRDRQTITQGSPWGKANFNSNCHGKWGGQISWVLFDQQGLNLEFWKSVGLTGIKPRVYCAALGQQVGQQPTDIQYGNSNLKSTWNTQWGVIHSSYPRQAEFTDASGNKKPAQCHFPSPSLSIREPVQCWHPLPNLLTWSPDPPVEHLHVILASVSEQWTTSP